MSHKLNAGIAVIGIDIGKNSFHVVGLDRRGAIVLRQKWSRGQVETRLANLPPCLIGMEACVGAHHLSRRLTSLGHDARLNARLMPAKYVRPYSRGQKNDFRDAEAIAEAVQRPTMKFVATKTAEQLDLQALHRVRERLVSQRTSIINQIRAFLLERAVAVRQGLRFLRAELPRILATPCDALSPRMLRVIEDLAGDWRRLDERIEDLSSEIEVLARRDVGCERLMGVPGIGPIISSAMVAAIGSGDAFTKGRDFAAWLGLVPKQISTGDRTILGKISVQRPTMKFVATKTAEQLDLQALHRVRERLVSQRTGIINQIRAFLLERGVAVRQGLRFLRAELPRILATPCDALSPRMLRVIEDLAGDWRRLDERIEDLSSEIKVLARRDVGCERLMGVPGIGPIISSAMVAAIGSGDAFTKGRDFAAWLGLVPKQISTGDRTILGKISKRGNRYLRVLFVQAAWVVLIKPKSWQHHGLKPWLEAAKKRLHHNVLAIALANKLARIAWSVLDENDMEDRSSRRMRTLVTLMAR